MTIKNVQITTETKYEHDDDNNSIYGKNSRQTPILKLEIQIPNGQAIYEIPISSDLRSSIEKASELQK